MSGAFCTSCGHQFEHPEARFCGECGAPNAHAAAPSPPPSLGAASPASPSAGAGAATHAEASPAAAHVGFGQRLMGGLAHLAEGVVAVERAFNAFNTLTHPNGSRVVVGACKKDPHDPTDVPYDLHSSVSPDSLPSFVDLRDHMTPVEDQGELGSCTANAIAGAYEYLEKRINGTEGRVSRLFIYYNERKLEGDVNQDAGASLRDGMKVLQQVGACSEDVWPYRIKAFKQEPPRDAFDQARGHTIDEYKRVPIDLHGMRTCLAEGYPFVFGTRIYKSFEEDGTHGRIQMPRPGEEDLGSHAMLCVGYSDKDQVFLVRNSWGADWGDRGYAYFPYRYLTNTEWTEDAWTVRRAHNLDFSQNAEPGQSSHPSGRISFFEEEPGTEVESSGDAAASRDEMVFTPDEVTATDGEEAATDESKDDDSTDSADDDSNDDDSNDDDSNDDDSNDDDSNDDDSNDDDSNDDDSNDDDSNDDDSNDDDSNDDDSTDEASK